jgi:hypothetical protein
MWTWLWKIDLLQGSVNYVPQAKYGLGLLLKQANNISGG